MGFWWGDSTRRRVPIGPKTAAQAIARRRMQAAHHRDGHAPRPGAPRQQHSRLGRHHLHQRGLLCGGHDGVHHMLDLVKRHVAHQVFGRLQLRKVLHRKLRHLAGVDVAVFQLHWQSVFAVNAQRMEH